MAKGSQEADVLRFLGFVESFCPRLEELDLRGCSFLGSSPSLLPLSRLPALSSITSLDLSRAGSWAEETRVPRPAVANLNELRALPFWHSLRFLNLEGNRLFPDDEQEAAATEAAAAAAARKQKRHSAAADFPPHLTKLNLSYTAATDRTLERVVLSTLVSLPTEQDDQVEEGEEEEEEEQEEEEEKGCMTVERSDRLRYPERKRKRRKTTSSSSSSSGLEHLYLSGCQRLTTAGTARAMRRLKRLHTLFLSFTNVVDKTTNVLVSSLPASLKVLSLTYTRLDDEALRYLPRGLEALYMGYCDCQGSFAHLPPGLKVLQLDRLVLADDAISQLPRNLSKLSLLGSFLLTEDALRALPPQLNTLQIDNLLCDHSVALLPQSLQHLTVVGSDLSDQGLSQLPPTLRSLCLVECRCISDDALASLSDRITAYRHDDLNHLFFHAQ
jgi:hypothetical protein